MVIDVRPVALWIPDFALWGIGPVSWWEFSHRVPASRCLGVSYNDEQLAQMES